MSKKLKKFMIGGIVVTFVLVIVNIYSYGKVSGNKQADQLDLGYKYLSEMDYERAEATFRGIINVDGGNYEAYLGLAEVYSAMDEPDMAEEVMKEAADKCEYGKIQIKVVEAEAGLRQFRSMADYSDGFESVSGLTDFCVQGLDIFLGWIERASTVVDGISSVWREVSRFLR